MDYYWMNCPFYENLFLVLKSACSLTSLLVPWEWRYHKSRKLWHRKEKAKASKQNVQAERMYSSILTFSPCMMVWLETPHTCPVEPNLEPDLDLL
mmetsp:Transcript_42587/g.120378  ORF Transcript_42587/g.120378 Transcript_42587/m.120378 type:complete len:95 (+) Transcript_42587:164-448(+)